MSVVAVVVVVEVKVVGRVRGGLREIEANVSRGGRTN